MNASEIRNLFETAVPEAAHAETGLELGHMYLPSGHIKAIALDRPIVVGDRGAGKSFWLKSLVAPERRRLIGEIFDVVALLTCDVVTGFDPTTIGDYPDSKVLADLIQREIEPADIWYTVLIQACIPAAIPDATISWSDKIKWVNTHAESVTSRLREKNQALVKSGRSLLIAFDGLDRLAPQWGNTVSLVRGLLQAQLHFGQYSHLRTKAFIRPDLFSDSEIRRFPDASKLMSLAVKLEWQAIDLYGLMWQYAANSTNNILSTSFRKFSKTHAGFQWHSNNDQIFVLDEKIRHNESKQEFLFHLIAGKTMGGKRSGNTWTWLPNHLSDANGYTSPRSFLVALRSAAEDSKKRKFVGAEYALHPSSIKEGVSKASEVRRNELEENLPWITDIFGPLRGLPLPSRKQDVVARWKKSKTLDKILNANGSNNIQVPLPEQVVEGDPGSILLALAQLGLCRLLSDGRVDFPDIVRVDAGMTRKGGVPVR